MTTWKTDIPRSLESSRPVKPKGFDWRKRNRKPRIKNTTELNLKDLHLEFTIKEVKSSSVTKVATDIIYTKNIRKTEISS